MSKELGKIDFVGARHFDWTYVEEVFPADEVLTLFREPVSRTISHFNFMKKLSWTKGMKIKEQSLDEFLEDKASMMEFRGCWQDGQAGVSWLTGTHIAEWVRKGENTEKDPETLERWFFDYEKQLTEAADKIDKMFWFGILEDLDRSLELLAFQLDKPVNHLKKITHQNLHKIEPSLPTEKSTKFLRNLMPQDIWLYDYAKRVFEARWLYYKTRIYQHPKRPEFPEIFCKSTRFILRCDGTQNGKKVNVFEKLLFYFRLYLQMGQKNHRRTCSKLQRSAAVKTFLINFIMCWKILAKVSNRPICSTFSC